MIRFSTALTISAVLHGVCFLGAGTFLVRSAQYGVESGSGMEISLVAAAAEGGRTTSELQVTDPSENDGAAEKPAQKPAHEGLVGDGSSPMPGPDPATFYSEGGAVLQNRSRHLKNPAPPYPWTAVARGQEGLVVLAVSVDEGGRPIQVEIEKSSGFPLLDEASRLTVRRWKFDPSHVGPLTARSDIKVPIRFVLSSTSDLQTARD